MNYFTRPIAGRGIVDSRAIGTININIRREGIVADAVLNFEKKHLLRWIFLLAFVLAIPILPFLGFGDSLETRIASWLDTSISTGFAALLVIGLLAADIFLPVPSSIVCTFSGKMLGFWAGTVSSWCGMTVGAVFAFGLVRLFGRPLAQRLSTEEELIRMDKLGERYGTFLLVVMRPVPIFAEASVLFMGVMRLGWRRFLIAVGFSNFGIAAVYAALGDRVQLPIALAASIAAPLFFALIARWLIGNSVGSQNDDTTKNEPEK